MNREEGRYRVLLISIRDDTEAGRQSFCSAVSENYGISFPLLMKIVDRCPIILKKNLSLEKAVALAGTLKSLGAMASVEEKRNSFPVFLEFEDAELHQVALESSSFRRTEGGLWNVTGRVKNISEENLNDTWALIQLFDGHEEFLTFEEVRIPISPLFPGKASPFKAAFEEHLPIKKVSIAFKTGSGHPLPAVDRRPKDGWVKVEIDDEKVPPSIELRLRTKEVSMAGPPVLSGGDRQPLESEISPLLREAESREAVEETVEASGELALGISPQVDTSEERDREKMSQPAPPVTLALSPRELGEEELSHEVEGFPVQPQDVSPDTPSVSSAGEEAAATSLENSGNTDGKEETDSPCAPWVDEFRNSIEAYYQKPRGIFITWFEAQRKGDGFLSPFHCLLTILVHARFDQMNHSEKALENTERVFRLSIESNLQLEQIPPLEGVRFFSGEDWRILFYRTIPKLQEVSNTILSRGEWDALDLERAIQVIPHVSQKNSRVAVRWIHELIADIISVDFSNAPVSIEESLYRVASRLGVVDPNCDFYQGESSIGDLKIQSFSKAVFPSNPLKVEEPMTWAGRKEEGGHCFPTQPRCKGCLFEVFCPRLHLDLDPSEKGMKYVG